MAITCCDRSTVHTPTVHAFLRFLRDEGFEAASQPIGVDPDGRERLSYIAGDVAVPPYPAWARERHGAGDGGRPAPSDA